MKESFTFLYIIWQNRKIQNFKWNGHKEFMESRVSLFKFYWAGFYFHLFVVCWLQLQHLISPGNYFKMGFSKMLFIIRAQITGVPHQAQKKKWWQKNSSSLGEGKAFGQQDMYCFCFQEDQKNSPYLSCYRLRVKSRCLSKLSSKLEKKTCPWNTPPMFDYQDGQFWACWQFSELKNEGKYCNRGIYFFVNCLLPATYSMDSLL